MRHSFAALAAFLFLTFLFPLAHAERPFLINISIEPNPILQGVDAKIYGVVANETLGGMNGVLVNLYQEGIYVDSALTSTQDCLANETKGCYVFTHGRNLAPGTYRMRVEADANKTIFEEDILRVAHVSVKDIERIMITAWTLPNVTAIGMSNGIAIQGVLYGITKEGKAFELPVGRVIAAIPDAGWSGETTNLRNGCVEPDTRKYHPTGCYYISVPASEINKLSTGAHIVNVEGRYPPGVENLAATNSTFFHVKEIKFITIYPLPNETAPGGEVGLYGYVYASDGTPLDSVYVTAYDLTTDPGKTKPIASAWTSYKWGYRMGFSATLPAGMHTIFVNTTPFVTNQSYINVGAGAFVTINLRPNSSYVGSWVRIGGTVYTETGKRMPGEPVTLYDLTANNTLIGTVRTDQSGNYEAFYAVLPPEGVHAIRANLTSGAENRSYVMVSIPVSLFITVYVTPNPAFLNRDSCNETSQMVRVFGNATAVLSNGSKVSVGGNNIYVMLGRSPTPPYLYLKQGRPAFPGGGYYANIIDNKTDIGELSTGTYFVVVNASLGNLTAVNMTTVDITTQNVAPLRCQILANPVYAAKNQPVNVSVIYQGALVYPRARPIDPLSPGYGGEGARGPWMPIDCDYFDPVNKNATLMIGPPPYPQLDYETLQWRNWWCSSAPNGTCSPGWCTYKESGLYTVGGSLCGVPCTPFGGNLSVCSIVLEALSCTNFTMKISYALPPNSTLNYSCDGISSLGAQVEGGGNFAANCSMGGARMLNPWANVTFANGSLLGCKFLNDLVLPDCGIDCQVTSNQTAFDVCAPEQPGYAKLNITYRNAPLNSQLESTCGTGDAPLRIPLPLGGTGNVTRECAYTDAGSFVANATLVSSSNRTRCIPAQIACGQLMCTGFV